MRDISNEQVIQVSKNGINYIQFRKLLELGIKHAYTLKSENIIFKESGYGNPMYLSNYKKLCGAVGINSNAIALPKQNHTANVKLINRTMLYDELDNIDGLVTDKRDIVLATTNADCILYLMYDPVKKVIGNVHSGWRGSYQRIIEKAVDKMKDDFDCKTKDIIVCICPSIRKCCFEVDEDVKEMFYDKFCFIDKINQYILNTYNKNKYYIDTVGINNYLLMQKGIQKENIYDCNICSNCNDDLIHSFRAEGKKYELATAIISL